MKSYQIDFEPIGRRGKCPAMRSVLDCAHELGIGINSVCDGHGTCGTCKVCVVSGDVSAPCSKELEIFSPQRLAEGWRLACQLHPASDIKLLVPLESMTTSQRLQVESLEVTASLEPPVCTYPIAIPAPSLSDLRADADRLVEVLWRQHQVCCQSIDVDVLRKLSPKLRDWSWQAGVSVHGSEVVAVSPSSRLCLGLAVDLGSTKIAGYLINLDDGHALAMKGVMNPQISYGEDILSRISRVLQSPPEAERIQGVTIETLNRLVADMCAATGTQREDILEAVIVGNTAMHHLLLHLPVAQLASSPFVSAVSQALDIKARDLGLQLAPGAYVHILPNIAGFVGADHVAMLLAIEAASVKGLVIALDIGTNTEVSLIDNGRITSVSCASGPAFEGGHIRDGMRAAGGAIERLQIEDGQVNYQTIDDKLPVGICGSGIIDAMAQLFLAGLLDTRGRLTGNHPRIRYHQKQREFIIVPEAERHGRPAIGITQHDVRELQLAKAAIRAGIAVLLENRGCSEKDIDQFIIAGAFGSYLDVSSAIAIGIFPPLPLKRFRQVGNAAGTGARLALTTMTKRCEAQELASKVTYLELANEPAFKNNFIEASYLGKYWLGYGKREETDGNRSIKLK